MIRLDNVKLLNILPENIRNDPDMIAESSSLDVAFNSKVNIIKELSFLSNIYEAQEDLLDHIAFQFNIDSYDISFDIETKRALIDGALYKKKVKGTSYSVKNVLNSVFGDSKLEEWFEYGGSPYNFRVELYATKRGLSQSDLIRVERAIEVHKNTRSHLESIKIYLTGSSSVKFASALITGEEISVLPWSPKNIESKAILTMAVGSNTGVETVEILPERK